MFKSLHTELYFLKNILICILRNYYHLWVPEYFYNYFKVREAAAPASTNYYFRIEIAVLFKRKFSDIVVNFYSEIVTVSQDTLNRSHNLCITFKKCLERRIHKFGAHFYTLRKMGSRNKNASLFYRALKSSVLHFWYCCPNSIENAIRIFLLKNSGKETKTT